MSDPLPRLDPLLHQPVRTQIVAFLSGRGEATFNELKRALAITDGNLGAHLGKLVEAELVAPREEAGGARLQTVFALTTAGRKALADYVRQLSSLVQLSGKAAASAGPALMAPARRRGAR
jgi:DNA-binding transcriptional ArsR family regulator